MECMQYIDTLCVCVLRQPVCTQYPENWSKKAEKSTPEQTPKRRRNKLSKRRCSPFHVQRVTHPIHFTASHNIVIWHAQKGSWNTKRDFNSAFSIQPIPHPFYFKHKICNYMEYLWDG